MCVTYLSHFTWQVIIPNVMGMVIYQPAVNKDGVSPVAEAFCKALTQSYRVNIFDQLVFRGDAIAIGPSQRARTAEPVEVRMLRWMDLCYACSRGDSEKVRNFRRHRLVTTS